MPAVDNSASAMEEPWVTELLRDVLLEEAFIPVWRYATEYHPCEGSAMEAIHMLPLPEQEVLCALYRDELPLESVYEKLHIGAAVVANTLGHALAQLRKPCLLRIILKGKATCERESAQLRTLSAEDVLLLGVETLSLPVGACDVCTEVGVRTIENLMCLLIYGTGEDEAVPVPVQGEIRSRMVELRLWAPLRNYLLSEENLWWQRLYSCATAAPRYQGDSKELKPTKERVLGAMAKLPPERKEVLLSLYAHGASERMYARRKKVTEESIIKLHHLSLVEFARIVRS